MNATRLAATKSRLTEIGLVSVLKKSPKAENRFLIMKTSIKRIWIATITSLLLFLFGIYQVFGQATQHEPKGSIAISLHQDIRLATLGDNKGNDAFALNFLARVKLEGNQDRHGFLTVYPEYEYANLKGGKYVRYSVNTAYVLNQIFNNIELSGGFGYGWIDRHGTISSISLNGELAYYLSDRIKLSLVGQYTQRQDIDVWRYSSFFGIEFKI